MQALRKPCLHTLSIRLPVQSEGSTRARVQEILHSSPDVTDVDLILANEEQLVVVTNELQRQMHGILKLALVMESLEKKSTLQALAESVANDTCIKSLTIQVGNGLTDALGVALATALTTNTTLQHLFLSDQCVSPPTYKQSHMGVAAYHAMSAMLRVNTQLQLTNPTAPEALQLPVSTSRNVRAHQIRRAFQQLCIEKRLNAVGRGRLLAAYQTTRTEWVDSIIALSAFDSLQVDCTFSLLQLNPLLCPTTTTKR